MQRNKYLFLWLIILLTVFLAGCTQKTEDTAITTTIFPIYDFTRQITKDKLTVKLILPPGVEPHTYDMKPRDILTVRNSKLFIYTGDFLEVWATKLVNVLDDDKVTVINASHGLDLHPEEETDEGHDHAHDENIDPHIWVDPILALSIVDNILEGIIAIDPENETFYRENAAEYKAELLALDAAYQDLFAKVEYKTIIFGGHFVFGYLAERYDINHVSPYRGFSPDTLPTPKNLQNLINLIKATGIRTIFYEEMLNPKVAEVIAEETQVELLPLNGGALITKRDLETGMTYLDLMYQNIENLKKGLNYHE